ncbi:MULTISPECIES: cell envelope integrity protein TolA [Bacillus cereus group]|uniref:cell envelope integrity protein TolA n=1 Tax=Bacillus cereus group TaxID=86661 RepID=UPI001298CAA1|nr:MULTISPECIES: cell envelope integrity protein TolA [Bacillus cereus group]MCQ6298731.1 cell envelope integrity protein TolA [Bacillus cereus]MCQ6378105.1 cell envelope integrity protein TolA [Bacillus cereus]MDA2536739.1 cell envelope integrity protein TolA [Bacillus cereus]MRC37341.1 cell envelope integrity protein TolA [Bacillus thuringiensis]MRC68077.1 cell envelope integrity protein TolA [Bacillus thuringiensis]
MNWRKIFGYRSKTAWKMFIASIVYIFILFLILQAIIPNSIRPALVNIGFLGFPLSLLALIIGLIKPQFVLPKIQIKTRKKVVYSYLYLALAFFLMGIVFIDGKSTSNQTVQKADTKVATSQDTKKDTADTKSKEEAQRKAQEETERKAQEEADRKAQEEANRKAQEETQRKAQEEANHKAQEETQRKAQEEANHKAQEEAQRKAQEEANRKAQEEANRKAQEEANRKAQEEASQKSNAVVSSSSGNHNGSNRKPFQNDPSDDKEANTTCKGQIKGNANSKKYHVPGGQYYDSTKDNIVWFCSEADAQAAGYVRSKK